MNETNMDHTGTSHVKDEHLFKDVYEGYQFPSLVARVKALFVDVIILLIIFVIGSQIIDLTGGAPGWVRGAILIFTLYLYEPLLISTTGGTIGHHSMKLTVRSIKNPDKKLYIINALFRIILKSTLGWISFLTVTSNARKRAIHDIGSGSIVFINKPK